MEDDDDEEEDEVLSVLIEKSVPKFELLIICTYEEEDSLESPFTVCAKIAIGIRTSDQCMVYFAKKFNRL